MIRIVYIFIIAIFGLTACHTNRLPSKTSGEYTDSVKAFLAFIQKEIHQDTLILSEEPTVGFDNCFANALEDTIFFTETDRKSIAAYLEKPPIQQWSASYFSQVKLINPDTIDAIFKDRDRSWSYFHQHIGKNFYRFSAPIFLRNYTYCLFYMGNQCGPLCGQGQLALYKREQGAWVIVKAFCRWIS